MNNNLFKKIVVIFSSIMVSFGLCFSFVNKPVHAKETRAIEYYTKTIDVSCGALGFGYVTVDVVIGHNMTTKKLWVDSSKGTPHFNGGWAGLRLDKVTTSPGNGETISGKSIKVNIYYSNYITGISWSSSDYLTL